MQNKILSEVLSNWIKFVFVRHSNTVLLLRCFTKELDIFNCDDVGNVTSHSEIDVLFLPII